MQYFQLPRHLPIFISKKDGKVLIDQDVIENIANIYEKEGSDCWFSDDPQRFLGEKYKATDFNKMKDIVEVWFDSGSTHSFVLEKRKDLKWPESMYLEGSDKHRGWIHSSLLESCGTRGRAPYENILSHGFVVDGKGTPHTLCLETHQSGLVSIIAFNLSLPLLG